MARQTEVLKIKKEDLKKLNIGECYTYKKLCDLLDIPYYKGGNQKKSQIDQFELFFSYEKTEKGGKYIINSVYDEPLDFEYKYPSNTKYANLIKIILLQYLSKKSGYKVYITSSQLWYQLGMINGYFIRYKKNREEIKKINPSMTSFEINDFYTRCSSKFSSIIASAFSSLQNQKLILVNKVSRIETTYVDRYGVEFTETRDATEKEEEVIMHVEHEVLKELGLSSIKQIGFHKDSPKYYEKTAKIFKEKYNWDNVYKAFKIIYNKNDVIEEISKEELYDNKKLLNGKIIDVIKENAESNYDKLGLTSYPMIELMDENGGELPKEVFYYPPSYIEQQGWLTNALIKLND